jgi:tetratricopeptide (TPR) repeat protein
VIEMQGDYYYYGYRDYTRAASQYNRLLDLRPNSSEAYGSLGLIYRRQGHWADALASLHRALELDPHAGRYRTTLAEVLLALHHYDEARAEYHRMVADHPDLPYWGFQEVQVAFAARGSTGEADAWFAGLKPVPESADMILFLRKNWARTRSDWAEALRLDEQQRYFDGFGSPHWMQDLDRAWDYVGIGDMAKAKALTQELLPAVKKELAEHPSGFQALSYLGFSDALLGDREGALAVARKLAVLLPESVDAAGGPDVSRARAGILAWAGEKDEALAEFSRMLHVPYGTNVHFSAYDLSWLPLRDDPRFTALLADPKNNEPLY